VPDVAANADPLTGYQVYFRGKWYVGAGTSAAAPLWAGLLARLNQLKEGRLGLITPALYRRYQDLLDRGALRSIRAGAEGSSKWNPHTGLGVPHGARLAHALTLPGRARRGR
jgi:kumamolisin